MTLLEPSMYHIAACMPPILGYLSQVGYNWVSQAWSSMFGSSRSKDSESVALRQASPA